MIWATRASAQISVYPPVLYSGNNVLTINASKGLRSVSGYLGGRWTPLHTGLSAPYVKVTSAPMFASCAKRVNMSVYIMLTRPARLFKLRVEDCGGDIKYFDFADSEEWNVYREQFGNVMVGATACHTFRVDARGTTVTIDSVSSPSPLFQIRYPYGRPPLRVSVSGSFLYDVCFKPLKPGFTKVPIHVYLRRKYPAGGYTNFIVADTAYVNVVPRPGTSPTPPRPQPRPTPRPRPRLIAQPKPIIIERPKPRPAPRPVPRPAPPADTPRTLPPTLTVPARSVPIEPAAPIGPAPEKGGDSIPTHTEMPLTDPTAYRVITMPTARSVDSGKIFAANYDAAGWLAGYGLTDRLTVLAGGVYVPPAISYNLVLTGGARYELYREGSLRAAAGMQATYSRTDLSTIVLLSPYAVASLGDDDSRISLGLGYTWRRHTPRDSAGPFTRRAVVGGIGGDIRIGYHWKVASEAYVLEDASIQPLVTTLRYFGEHYAVDVGIGVDLAIAGSRKGHPRVAPVVSLMWVW